MTDVTPQVAAGTKLIQSYGPGRFAIDGVVYEGPVLVFADRVEAWNVTGFASLTADSFAPVRAAIPTIEVVLLGCGPKQQFLPAHLRRGKQELGFVLDAMETGAACRTFNVLLTEDRRVCAALLPV
ncbi:Mth938-like domain-containing protein [Roseiterribacter gracilis]|uniref:Uncharacterized protein n=1 Tax=Roseiterribacter gracilis TaxID=2812848 RepID=A0A8S8XAX9_9PROT|nr:hypothetical protein TMPK1_06370 [Rhodospirillales bacterium TMPK1]